MRVCSHHCSTAIILPSFSMAGEKKRAPAARGASSGGGVASAGGSARQVAAKRKRLAKEFLAYTTTPGYAFTFGTGEFGSLGLGEDVTTKYRAAAVDVDGKRLLSVVCGGMHTVALAEDGSVYTWGVNDEGSLGRCTAGTAWHQEPESRKEDCFVPGQAHMPKGVLAVQVVAGDGFTFVLTEEGAVYGWGQFKDDVCSTKQFSPTVKLQRLPARVYQPESARDAVTKLASGVGHVAALTRRGEVLTWGMGTQGQLGRVAPYTVRDPPPLTALLTPSAVPGIGAAIGPEVVDIGCGHYSTYAVSKRGGVAAWGLNNMGQLGLAVIVEGEAAAAAAAGDGQANGHAAAAANGDAGGPINHAVWAPQAVPGLTKGVSAAAGGEHHALLLHKASSVLSCGRSLYGMLGRAAAADDAALPEPQPVDATDGLAGEKPVSVAAGMNVSACVTAEGNLYTWGSNVNYQLAKGQDEDDSLTPTRMRRHKTFGNRRVLQISFGGQHAALLASEDLDAPLASPAAAAAPAGDGAGTSAQAAAAAAGDGGGGGPSKSGKRGHKAAAAEGEEAGGAAAGGKASKRQKKQ